MASRDAFRPGQRITRDALNKRIAAPPAVRISGPRVNSPGRGAVVITDEEDLYFRITSVGASPRRYAWREVLHDRATGAWSLGNRTGGLTDDPAFEINGATLAAGSTVYRARRARSSGVWLFSQGGGGGGIVNIKSGDTRLMILGTYDDYKDCEGVPPKPPTTWADSCGTTRTTTLCVPAYAYAVYQRCGYIWQKVGDTRDFGVWANETNGGSTGAWGRFHVPCWGGDRDPVTWLPDPNADCIGVSFEANGGSAISCSCPTWFTAISCLQITVKWIDEPAGDPPVNCSGCWDLMASRWGTQETTTILYDFMGCVLQGDIGPFPVNLLWTQFDWGADCFWGPDEFDPCDPCSGFGKLVLSINSAPRTSGGCGNPATVWMSWELKAKQLRDLICDCGTGPLRLSVGSPALACGQLAEWVEISCCPGDTIMGGTPGSLPADFISGGTPGSLPTDFIDGNY